MKRLEINPSQENLSPADLHYRNCYRKFLRLKGNDSWWKVRIPGNRGRAVLWLKRVSTPWPLSLAQISCPEMFCCTHCPALWFWFLFPNSPQPVHRSWNHPLRSWPVVHLLRGRVEWEIAESAGMRLTCISGLCAHIVVYSIKCVVWSLGCRPRCLENAALTPLAFPLTEHPRLCMLLLRTSFLPVFAWLRAFELLSLSSSITFSEGCFPPF